MATKTSLGECLVPGQIKFHALPQTSQHFNMSEKQIKIKNVDTPGGKKENRENRVKFNLKVGILTKEI